MTLAHFQLLNPQAQLTIALIRGTYLARRVGPAGRFHLYHLANKQRGFFVEVGHDEQQYRALVVRSFDSAVPLVEYAQQVRLPVGT